MHAFALVICINLDSHTRCEGSQQMSDHFILTSCSVRDGLSEILPYSLLHLLPTQLPSCLLHFKHNFNVKQAQKVAQATH